MSQIKKISKIVLLSGILTGGVLFSFADRGINKKAKNRVALNIPTNNNFKKALSLNLRSGLKYTGSLIAEPVNNSLIPIGNTLITYQKGNTIYIVPFKQKMLVSEIRQGYTGMKLIIKSN